MLRTFAFLFSVAVLGIFCSAAYAQGLQGEYFDNRILTGEPVLTRVEAVNFNWAADSPGDPLGVDNFSVRWTGSITAPVTGDYIFGTRSDDGVRLWVGIDQAINNWNDHSAMWDRSTPIPLKGGEPVGITLEYYENGGDAVIELYWSNTDAGIAEEPIPASVLTPELIPAVKAYRPIPADGFVGLGIPVLQWSAGETAIFHRIYVGTDPNLTEADLQMDLYPINQYAHGLGFVPGETYYWRVDEIEQDMVTVHVGDVWSFVAQGVTAYHENPADGTNTVSTTPELTWMPGMDTYQHRVYFSDDLDAVTQGAAEADKGTLEVVDANFVPDVLDELTTHYWRVDEILTNNSVMTGPVWNFTTARSVDDFESYVDDWETDDAIWEIWIDGLTNGTGAIVGNFDPPFAEQAIVHSGLQSMPIDYNNVDAPFYSEAEREFASAQDWTAGGADTMVLFVRGLYVNDAAPVYVGLQDTSNKAYFAVHPDPALATSVDWVQWAVPFSELTAVGVNPARIKKIYIGVGDRDNPQPDGAGRIYVDDIIVTKPAPVVE